MELVDHTPLVDSTTWSQCPTQHNGFCASVACTTYLLQRFYLHPFLPVGTLARREILLAAYNNRGY